MDYFSVGQPLSLLSDPKSRAYHGRPRTPFRVPGMRCSCRRGSYVPIGSLASAACTVPPHLIPGWPALPGIAPNDLLLLGSADLLTPEAWQAWRSSFLRESALSHDTPITPWMYLQPMYFKRTSRAPFSFLFPLEFSQPHVISARIADQLEMLQLSGVSIGHFEDSTEAATLHVANEARVTDARAQRCERCGAWVIDTKRVSSAHVRRELLDMPVQLVGLTLVVSGTVLSHIQPQIDTSLHPPRVERFQPPSQA